MNNYINTINKINIIYIINNINTIYNINNICINQFSGVIWPLVMMGPRKVGPTSGMG